ncbi:putative Dynactin subunit 5 [Hypsibius exemplaris]|uniref:Dynactin subunit 5 n=1 Tax=Hypsibius exemplaris TaxID=2072580 RepID=A0A9X6NNU9_HYPEX|nr:putative Dynactin subunit 5 [Hypsibius exemplaris]
MYELQEQFYNPKDFVETNTGNKVNKKTILCGSQQILLTGKSILDQDSVIRADLATVRIGRNLVLSRGAILKPTYKPLSKAILPSKTGAPGLNFMYQNMKIGEYVFVGEKSVIQAVSVGNHVYIGNNCVISRGVIIHDCVSIADNTFVPPDTVIPVFTIFAGNIGKPVGTLPDCTQELMENFITSYYAKFLPQSSRV